MSEAVRFELNHPWHEQTIGPWAVFAAGREKSVARIVSFLHPTGPLEPALLKAELAGLPGCYAVVAESERYILVIGDKIRGFPIFYGEKDGAFIVSNSARAIQRKWGLQTVDPDGRLDLHMTGYITGRRTFFQNLFQVQAGEYLLWDKVQSRLIRERYYLFYSPEVNNLTENDLIDELDRITNAIFLRNIEDAGGRRIAVPLSGGLDSRLVLCKLKQLGYDNLICFSFGVKGNYEAITAKKVAEQVGVPWSFLPTTGAEARRYFASPERKAYWDYADGLSVIPNLNYLYSLRALLQRGDLRPGDVLINGQTGDFITGDHIPAIAALDVSRPTLHTKILEKHYKMKRRYLEDPPSRARACRLIDESLAGDFPLATPQDFAKLYELWEWQERQCKRVVHGQRMYDYMGMAWELPFWEVEYLDFWARLPLQHKMGRRLFKRYVECKDFKDVFKKFSKPIPRWPRNRMIIQHTGRIIKALLGSRCSRAFYARLDYFSHYHYLYAPIGYGRYLRHCAEYSGPYPYLVDFWETENMEASGEKFG